MYQVLWWVLYPCYSIYFSQQLCELDVSICILGFPGTLVAQRVKHLPAMQETWVRSLSQEDPLVKEMATHSSILAWRIPWTEEPGGLQSTGSQRVRHDWATSHTHTFIDRCPINVQSKKTCFWLMWVKLKRCLWFFIHRRFSAVDIEMNQTIQIPTHLEL